MMRQDLIAASRTPHRGDAAAPVVRAGITGSADSLVLLTWTEADLQRERAAGVRVLRRAGIDVGMRVANTLPGALASPGSLLLGDVIEDCGALDVPLGSIDNDAAAKGAWELIDRVEANVLIVDPATAERFFAAAGNGARPWLSGIVYLRTDGAATCTPPVAYAGFSGWQRWWFAAAEVASFLASTCSAGATHLDSALRPSLDAGRLTLTRVADGFTYTTGFAATLASPCGCGDSAVVIEIA